MKNFSIKIFTSPQKLFTDPPTFPFPNWPYQQFLTNSSLISLQLSADLKFQSGETFCAAKLFTDFHDVRGKFPVEGGKIPAATCAAGKSTRKSFLIINILLSSPVRSFFIEGGWFVMSTTGIWNWWRKRELWWLSRIKLWQEINFEHQH